MEQANSRLEVGKIRLDGGTQPRAELRYDIIDDYAEEMRQGTVFPDVTVFFDGSDYWLADGFHRVHAARHAGQGAINADIRQGTRRDAVLYSVGVNSGHGLRRNNADKRRAVETMLRDLEWNAWSDHKIAQHVRVSQPYVSKIRRELALTENVISENNQRSYITKHGTLATMDTANIGKSQPPEDVVSRAQRVVEEAAHRRANELASVLSTATPEVAQIVQTHGVDDPETVGLLSHWQNMRRETFDEVLASGYVQMGEEAEAVHISSGHTKVRDAMFRRAQYHQQLAIDRQRQRAYEMAMAMPEDRRYRVLHAGIQELAAQLEPGSVDFIITDPPYPREYLPLYEELAKLGARVLKPGGSVLALAGQSYLPDVLNLMAPHLKYNWTLSYQTPGGQSPQLWDRKVNSFWKPVVWFVNGDYSGQWAGDVVRSDVNDNDKRFHEWGQSLSGMRDLMTRFVQSGDVVLDPFVGGGTTGVIAVELGCQFIGSDKDKDKAELTKGRIVEAIRGTKQSAA